MRSCACRCFTNLWRSPVHREVISINVPRSAAGTPRRKEEFPMNKKWILALVMALAVMTMSIAAIAEDPTPTPPSSITVGDVTPTPAPDNTSSSSSSGSSSSSSSTRTSAPVATVAPAVPASEIAKADSVTVTSSNENVSVSVPATLPSAVLAQTATAIATATSIKTIVSAEVAASAQTLLGTEASLDDMKPRINVPLDITIKGDDAATVRLDLSKEITTTKVEVGAHVLGLVTMISGGSVSYDVATSTYLGEGKVDVDFTAEQLTTMAAADEVMYTLMSD